VAGTDRDRWNERYRAEEGVPPPSPWLEALDPLLPRRGRALDAGGGSGRHALWLAARGLEVTLADVSDVALARAAAEARARGLSSPDLLCPAERGWGGGSLATVAVDLEEAAPPAGPWDLVLCVYFLHRPLLAALPALLAPGGLLVVAHATRRNLERHPRPGPRHVLEDGELPGLVRGLEVIRSEEGWLEAGRHEARLVARRPREDGA
jgi:SAM-dependent methyltransferase